MKLSSVKHDTQKSAFHTNDKLRLSIDIENPCTSLTFPRSTQPSTPRK